MCVSCSFLIFFGGGAADFDRFAAVFLGAFLPTDGRLRPRSGDLPTAAEGSTLRRLAVRSFLRLTDVW